MNDSDAFVNLIVKYVSKEPTPMYPCADCSICLCCGAGDNDDTSITL